MKMSYWPVQHPRTVVSAQAGPSQTTLRARADNLYGEGVLERFLKDYNGQTIWLSVDLKAFMPDSRWPDFLDLALGYSAEHLYGGFDNAWETDEAQFVLDGIYPRSRQWVLALDYDLSSLEMKSEFGRGLIRFLDIFKWPAPGVWHDSERGWGASLIWR